MSQAEDLLNSLSENDISAKTEHHIVVDSNRVITVPSELKRIAVQYDHNIETVTFDCPRYWDDHDMSTMNVYINYTRADNEPGCYIADDVAVDETDTSIMHFSWTISRHVTEAVGPLTILICIKMVDKDGNEVNHWNSERNSEMTVSKGMECGYIIAEKYPDIISQILADMGNLADLTTEDKSSLVAAINEVRQTGGGVQSDWNQNDETAPDYVKNRPFYTGDPVETVLVEESTVSFSFAKNEGLYMAQILPGFEATVGETYKVYWDGAAYECTCVKFNNSPGIGNLSIVGAGPDTGEPFIMVVHKDLGITIGTADTSASHTVSISRFTQEVVKIDPKYIRDMYYTGDPVETVLVKKSTVSFEDTGEGYYGARFRSNFEATVGETYKVSWDGAAYECTCVDFRNTPVIGNLAIVGPGSDTGEPFLIAKKNVETIVIVTADTSASHTVSISGFVSEVVKIDEKYLPDTVATKADVEAAADYALTEAHNAQVTADNAWTTADNAKSEALDLAARMFGHTSVVDNAFYYDKTLSITSLPACIESIGNSAFSGCKNLALTSLPSGLTSIGNGAFSGCTKLALTSLPSGITSIGVNAFQGCNNLALTSLPSGLTSIGDYVFTTCPNLALTSLPSGITSIGDYAFRKCTGLTSITFTGKPTTISSAAFEECTNLTTINVPWAEGEVANAPWGATNATINYNYTGA